MRNMKILVIHGPNLNLLGTREPEVYGSTTLADINSGLVELGRDLGAEIECFQSNHEGEIIDQVHTAKQAGVDGIIINPGGLTHTSVSLRDAIAAVALPVVEVHLSNTLSREEFRHHSYIAPIAIGQVTGFGALGYSMALQGLLSKI